MLKSCLPCGSDLLDIKDFKGLCQLQVSDEWSEFTQETHTLQLVRPSSSFENSFILCCVPKTELTALNGEKHNFGTYYIWNVYFWLLLDLDTEQPKPDFSSAIGLGFAEDNKDEKHRELYDFYVQWQHDTTNNNSLRGQLKCHLHPKFLFEFDIPLPTTTINEPSL